VGVMNLVSRSAYVMEFTILLTISHSHHNDALTDDSTCFWGTAPASGGQHLSALPRKPDHQTLP